MTFDVVLSGLPFQATVTGVLVNRADKVVLEVVADGRPVIVKWDRSATRSAKEADVLARAGEAGLAVPGLVAASDNVLVMEKVGGRPLRTTDPAAVWQQAGGFLRGLHDLASAPSGAVKAIDPPGQRFADFIFWWADDVIAKVELSTLLDPAQIRELGNRCKELLAGIEPPARVLQHGDARTEHFLIDGRQLTGVIDLGDASIHDPAWDIATLTADNPERTGAVVAGYAPGPTLREHFDTFVPGYRLLRLISDLAWQHANDIDPASTLRSLLREHDGAA